MMAENLLLASGLSKGFDGVQALQGFSCAVNRGEVLGLIGPNGAGKTTLLNVLSRFVAPDRGSVTYEGQDLLRMPPHQVASVGVARTFQRLRLIRQITVLDNVLLAFRNQPGERPLDLFFRWRRCAAAETHNRQVAMTLLRAVGLDAKSDDRAEALSYGQQKLLSMVMCLASDAELLLLDEPIAGIAPEMREAILSIIRDLPRQGKSAIMIEHDIQAVQDACSRVVFMDAGRAVCEGTLEEVRNDPRVIEAYME